MKPFREFPEMVKSRTAIRALVLFFACAALFYLGMRWSSSSSSTSHLLFFSPSSSSSHFSPSVAISPNANKTFPLPPTTPSPPPPPPTPTPPEKLGIVDENGTMTSDFVVGDLNAPPDADEDRRNVTAEDGARAGDKVRIGKFQRCPDSMREYIPCLDNVEALKELKSTERGEKFERHCPPQGKVLDCLVPPPKDYKTPIPWPRSRDEVWFSNVPHTRLVDDKGGQNWIIRDNDKFRFPGGGTQFIHGADQYLNQITNMVPDIAFGQRTRLVLDVGCGVASFGAFLLSRNVTTLSIAPKDVHENQIQFALERGVPAMVAAFATRRLLYPSQAFELIHCSRCRINWTQDDGILLLEVNRMIRAGGYFAWAAQPVYKHEEAQQEAWSEMEDLTSRMCWELVKKEGYIAIWRKPLNNSCYLKRGAGVVPLLCDEQDDPDKVWYTDLKPCISRIPENGHGSNITTWPARLYVPPHRLQGVDMDAYMSKKELFEAESRYWHEMIESYVRVFRWKEMQLRNVMDMRASFGGFAAALVDLNVGCWVMNVVPSSGPNTLPVIYDRGLIGVAHDWCESFDTYPRTYDLLHAADLFSKEQKRCNITSILLEMDRILRPGGRAYIRDKKAVIEDVKVIAEAMRWKASIHETQEGIYANVRLLICDK